MLNETFSVIFKHRDPHSLFLFIHLGSKQNLVKKKRPTEKCNRQGNEIQMVHVRPPQFSVLHSAAILGDQVKLQKILKYFDESSLNVRDKYGRTPLIFSVLGDHQECTEILLKVRNLKEATSDATAEKSSSHVTPDNFKNHTKKVRKERHPQPSFFQT